MDAPPLMKVFDESGPSPLMPAAPSKLATESQLAWLALALTPGLGARRIRKGVEVLGDVTKLFQLSLTELESLQFPAAAANAVILLGITILIISSLTRIVDIRKEL